MSKRAKVRTQEVIRLMLERGWERLGVAGRVMFRLKHARLNYREAESWLTTCGVLPPKEGARP